MFFQDSFVSLSTIFRFKYWCPYKSNNAYKSHSCLNQGIISKVQTTETNKHCNPYEQDIQSSIYSLLYCLDLFHQIFLSLKKFLFVVYLCI
ncbi:hypothetical protein AQUCO_01000022v1 [Aquilegia coerulea]|uniref:Uncharacterized protein n=1 Tax=Aquilegia coerulea TaxID=218851 RepID=A0A2G5E7W7_AQUCA|nr:hypothetical protein AQUCO_01000022v1 [Aquilegia coerulea]